MRRACGQACGRPLGDAAVPAATCDDPVHRLWSEEIRRARLWTPCDTTRRTTAGRDGPRRADPRRRRPARPARSARLASRRSARWSPSRCSCSPTPPIVGHLGTAAAGRARRGRRPAGHRWSRSCVFLAYGTTAAVARRVGAGDLPAALRQGIDGMWLALRPRRGASRSAGAAVAPAGWCAAFGASAAVTPYAVTYLRISIARPAPAMLVVLAATGVLRGLQDTRTPLVVARRRGRGGNLVLNLAPRATARGWASPARRWARCWPRPGMAAAFVARRGARRPAARASRCGPTGRACGRRRAPGCRCWCGPRRCAAVLAARRRTSPPGWATSRSRPPGGLRRLDAAGARARRGRDRRAGHRRALPRRRRRRPGARDGDPADARVGSRRRVRARRRWCWRCGRAYVPAVQPTTRRCAALIASALVVVAVMQPVAGRGVRPRRRAHRRRRRAVYLAWAGLATLVVFAPLALAVLGLGGGLVALWWAFGGFMRSALRAAERLVVA